MKKLLLIAVAFLSPLILAAQIAYPGSPLSLKHRLKSAPALVEFPGVTAGAAQAYIETLPPRLKEMAFAIPFDTLISVEKQAVREKINDGGEIWRLVLHSPGAYSLNVIFSRFRLPVGAKLFLYTPEYQVVHGAYTSENKTLSGGMAMAPLPGDRLVIELDLPPYSGFSPELVISRVSHDFRGFFDANGITKAGECNVDINCPEGASWQVEKRAVVKFIRGGVWLCSGALINNTRNDGRPLLLTANHTIGTESHAETSVFYFRYERALCGSGTGPLNFTLSGSRLLATTSNVDFSLVELSSAPPKDYEPFYAGWDRRIVPYLDTVTCIHHPSGDVKKISKSYHRVLTADFGGGYDANTHWNISTWDVGTTEPGSSGSPLFNMDHRIVGDLTGGDASCSYNHNDYFQKFSVSWDKYPDSTNQLRYWLDPDSTGVSVLNGYDPYAGGKPVANFSIRPERIQVGRKVYVTDLSTGLPDTWSWTFANANPGSSNRQSPPSFKFNSPGTYQITLRTGNLTGSDSLTMSVNVYNFIDNTIDDNRVVENRSITLRDSSSAVPLSVNWSLPGSTNQVALTPTVEFSYAAQGEYDVTETAEFPDLTDTLIHYNRIRVLPDIITYRSRTVSNVDYDEHTAYLTIGTQGYIPGSNNLGINAYAEEFRNTSDTTFIVNGLTLPLEYLNIWSNDYYLPILVWNSQHQIIMRDSVLVSGRVAGSRITKWFRSPLNFDTLMYAGFQVKPWSEGGFAAKMATDRGEDGRNTGWVIKGSQWQKLTETAGVHTSLDISLETSILLDSYQKEISILPNYNNGEFILSLGNLVFRNVSVSVFNMRGQEIIANVVRSENQIRFTLNTPVSGVYVVRLMIDKYQFTTKLLVVK